MAIYSSVAPPSQQGASPSPAHAVQPIDIETWTVSALESLSVSPSPKGTRVSLSIPLDTARESDAARDARASAYDKARKEPMRRDSLKRRDALLRGKEGSRRRQRWENGE